MAGESNGEEADGRAVPRRAAGYKSGQNARTGVRRRSDDRESEDTAIDKRTGGGPRDEVPAVEPPHRAEAAAGPGDAEARGDADRAIERLYRWHRDDVFRAALRELRNVQDAEDVTQAAFVDAYRAVLRGSKPDSPRAWLLAIAENVRRRRFRSSLRGPREEPLDEAVAPEVAPLDAQELRDALADLPPAQREVFVLRELSGLSYDEIAEVKGTTVASVQMSLFRARQTLRAALEPPTVSRRGRVLMPFPAWVPQLLGRTDATLLSPRGFAAVGIAAVAIGGFAAKVEEPLGGTRQGPAVIEQASAARAGPTAALASYSTAGGAQPSASGSRPAPPAPPPPRPRTTPAAPSAAPAGSPPHAAPQGAPPAGEIPAPEAPAAPPGGGGSEKRTAPPAAAPTRPVVTQPAAAPTPAVPALELPQLALPQLALPQLELPQLVLPPLQTPEIAVPQPPLPVELPPVSVPAVTVPAVTVPTVTVPAVTVPAVTVPPVTVPPLLPPLPLPLRP